MVDAHKNLAISTVATAPSPATSGTSLVVAAGQGARFPTVPFNATIGPDDASFDPSNAEIVRVTAIATDTLTIVRAQEGTVARTVIVGDVIVASITAKSLEDIEDDFTDHLADPDPHPQYALESALGDLADEDEVDNSLMADMAEATIKLRAAGAGTGPPIDGSAAQLAAILAGQFATNLAIQAFTAAGAGTYTPTAGMKSCIVIVTGGGGGGGGADTSAGGSGDVGIGAGGGAGGTAIKFYTAADIGASEGYSIGGGGGGGTSAGGNGTNGTDTTFGAGGLLITGSGGTGGGGSGAAAADSQRAIGAAGGAASGGTLNISGGWGDGSVAGSSDGTVDITFGIGGSGGVSFWGGGGGQSCGVSNSLTTDVNQGGTNGAAYGSGGSGAVCLNSTTGAQGGNGATGAIIVIELLGT